MHARPLAALLALALCPAPALIAGCRRAAQDAAPAGSSAPSPAAAATADGASGANGANDAGDGTGGDATAAGDPSGAGGGAGDADRGPSALAEADARRVDAAARGAIDRGEIPGAVVLIVAGDRVVFHRAYGLRAREPEARPMRADTVFDLASLTKPVATAASIALLAERGKLRLSDPVARYVPGFAANGKAGITIEQLLLHTSGLPADNALSEYAGDRAAMLARALAAAPRSAPGEVYTYSDVGYIALGEVVARASSEGLDAFAREGLFEPLGMRRTRFSPAGALAAEAAPTERLGDRVLLGTVHDPRARALGGVAGHAGLFSTAADLGRFARMLIGGGALDGARVLAEGTVRELLAPRALPGGGRRAYLGAASGSAVSHTGFTGTSLWVDRARRIAVIILSNRVHPDGKGSADRLRREVVEAGVSGAMNALKDGRGAAARTAGGAAAVKTGVDALEEGGFAELRGRRVALLTHAAGRTRAGRSTIDALRGAPGVKLVALLSPEHGLRSTEDGAVADGRDPATGLPVYSLYGEVKRPSRDMLAGADTIVVDLQDAGARFYTYETTLAYTLEAAAGMGVRVVVLDRPNPTGGARIEGPVLDAGRRSFVGYLRVPVRHGMTLGELARMFVAEQELGTDLAVIPMKGWTRDSLFTDTGLAWTPPSPNLRSPAAALLYPGIGLLELTNVSVGRGTDGPFERLGAPWIDGARLAAALREARPAGVAITEATFTPRASAFRGEACHGVAFSVTAPRALDAVRLGLLVAVTLRRLHPAEWRAGGLGTLLGHERALAAITAGEPLDRVTATFREETEAFAARRRPYLLY